MPVRLLRRLLLFGIVLTGLLSPTLPTRAAPPALVLPSPAALATLLSSTPNPARNLYALGARLTLHTTLPISPIVNKQPTNYPVGRVDKFYVYDGTGEVLVPARLLYKTAHAYFYVQVGVHVNMAALEQSARTFEQHIYPTDVAAFGPLWIPGIDNDQHVTIFNGLLQGAGAAGYVSEEDLYPRSVSPYSNQRKILYMNLGDEVPGTASYNATVAHELQHVIHAHLHPMDEAWINEGSSVLAQVLNGYSADGWDQIKAEQPGAQLDVWDPNSDIGYGNGYLWMLYYYEHFGGDRATRLELADHGLSGLALFSNLLAKLGVHETANQLFANWVVANYVNNPAIDGGRYGYTHSSIHAVATSTESVPFTLTTQMQQYAANYINIPATHGKALTLTFTGPPTVSLLSTVPPEPGFWWSNRGDSVDDTLTLPPLDLRGVTHATLRYQVWYQLEKDYDYGYVEVSTDGGKTWYAQQTPHTTAANPNGTNLAVGYTGTSCSAASAPHHCWLQEQVDLSRYAGKQILVRFEQVTDDELNLQGVAVTHMQVPQIGFDGDTTPTGWQAAGWVHADNTLAERWLVQAIVYRHGGLTVVPVKVDASGHGTLQIPAGSTRVVVAVSPLAPLTTVPNSYVLHVQ